MRITYDFYQRCTKPLADQLAAGHGPQGASVRQPERDRQGHGTERARRWRASWSEEPATADPTFLEGMIVKPQQTYRLRSVARRSMCRWPTSSTTRQKATSCIRTP